MTDNYDEFDRERYPYRYRMNVKTVRADRAMRWLRQAAEQLGIDAAFVTQEIKGHPDRNRRHSTDIGIGLTEEGDYAILAERFDDIFVANHAAQAAAQDEWDARVAEFKAMNPDWEARGLNPRLEIRYQDQLERGARSHDLGRAHDRDDGPEFAL